MTYYCRGFFIIVCGLFFLTSSLYAAQLKSIDSKTGVLSFEDGHKAVLMGIQLEEGALKTIASILSGKNVELDPDLTEGGSSEPPSVYLYVQTSQIDFPAKLGSVSKSVRIMVNEFLLSGGFATVSQDLNFKKRESFLKIQEEAKKRGSGIWSRVIPTKKKS